MSEYEQLSVLYNQHYLADEPEQAMAIALEQLDMDPSDSVALLRFALSVQGSCDKVQPFFSQYGANNEFQFVTELAKLVIKKECNIQLD
ncbi:hypothetical protein A3K86_03505 [Photobacterium jeanii]|uniref:Uncharacterized protein n=1 Tax=Photobacterium jeanii TaxID=858640 RepID=A0A178KKU0_9GAMM|nr:hypothetical protein [Photobacterium jeanii]OAN17998.1 hypothetical protein A3K86_03505 [Photobacterium jeanii]PST92332.1 hypothetical protein C9I91_03935 [Photobacterium jeanii]